MRIKAKDLTKEMLEEHIHVIIEDLVITPTHEFLATHTNDMEECRTTFSAMLFMMRGALGVGAADAKIEQTVWDTVLEEMEIGNKQFTEEQLKKAGLYYDPVPEQVATSVVAANAVMSEFQKAHLTEDLMRGATLPRSPEFDEYCVELWLHVCYPVAKYLFLRDYASQIGVN